MDNTKDYDALVNPTYETAKVTAFFLTQAGDENAKKVASMFEFKHPKQAGVFKVNHNSKVLPFISPIALESRYRAVSLNFKESGLKNFFDLACGYTPRGLDSRDLGVNYVGVDVPVVVNELNSAFDEHGYGDIKPVYIAGDATNPASLKKAADQLDGEIFISTEGIVSYLNPSELKLMGQAILELLKEHGGVWFTTDFSNILYGFFGAMVHLDPDMQNILETAISTTSKNQGIYADSTDLSKPENLEKFFEELGFKIERVPYYSEEFPVKTLEAAPEEVREVAKEVLNNYRAWKLTPAQTILSESANSQKRETEDLTIGFFTISDTLNMALTGRIDTLNAPAFLKAYDEAKEEADKIKKIVIDVKDLSYTSSTGLRVFMMMVKDVGPKNLKLVNTQDEVKEILEMSGMADVIEVA